MRMTARQYNSVLPLLGHGLSVMKFVEQQQQQILYYCLSNKLKLQIHQIHGCFGSVVVRVSVSDLSSTPGCCIAGWPRSTQPSIPSG